MSRFDESLGGGSAGSLGKAELRTGDFALRGPARQMFANNVLLSGAAGGSAPQVTNLRRSASVIETPVYQEPRLWRLEVLFTAPQSSPAIIVPTPWLPNPISPDRVRITVRSTLDRDKAQREEVFLIAGINVANDLLHAMPQYVVRGSQVGVAAAIVAADGSDAPTGGAVIGVQATLVEVSSGNADPLRNVRMLRYAQSAATAVFLEPNQHRKQFFVHNVGTTTLYVAFDESAVAPGLAARFVVGLEPGEAYESPVGGWQGYVSGIWTAAGDVASDLAMVTEVS